MKNNQTIAQFLGITKFPFEIKNDRGNIIYCETSNGYWSKHQYDTNGNPTHYENKNGYWEKREYDAKGNQIRYEDSDGFWTKRQYNVNGGEIYYENSYGKIRDNRPKQVELTLAEIASKLNVPLEQLRIKE